MTETKPIAGIETLAKTTPAKPAEKVDVKGVTETMLAVAEVSAATGEVLGDVESAESGESAEGQGFGEDEQAGKPKQPQASGVPARPLAPPPPAVMQKQIAAAIRAEIREKQVAALFAYLGIKKMQAGKLVELVAKIRSLKDLLYFVENLVAQTFEGLKNLYLQWVEKKA